MALNRIAFFSLGFSVIGFPRTVSAQTPPPLTAPPQAIAEARRVAEIMAVPLPSTPPTYVNSSILRSTGHTEWELHWNEIIGNTTYNSSFTIEAPSFKIKKFRNELASDESSEIFKTNPTIQYNESQAVAIASDLRTKLNLTLSDDWEFRDKDFTYLNGPNSQPIWNLFIIKNAFGFAGAGYMSIFISPFTGKIRYWSFDEDRICSPPQGTLLTREQAKTIAKNAFIQYMGANLLFPQDSQEPVAYGRGAWTQLHDNTNVYRIKMRSIFRLAEIPSSNPEQVLRAKNEIWVDVDAETGAVEVAAPFGAPLVRKKTIKKPADPARELIELVVNNTNSPYFFFTAMSKGIRERKPPRKRDIIRFAHSFGGKILEFSLDKKNNYLLSPDLTNPGKNFWMRIPKEVTQEFLEWLAEGKPVGPVDNESMSSR